MAPKKVKRKPPDAASLLAFEESERRQAVAPAVRGRKTHTVKCWPEFFDDIARGAKRTEMRWDDRDYQVGDDLLLQKYKPGSAADCGYLGPELRVRITHTMRGSAAGLGRLTADDIRAGANGGGSMANPANMIPVGWVLMSIELAEAPSVLIRALDRLCGAVEAFEVTTSNGWAPDDPLKAAVGAGRDALGVVQR